MRVSATLTIYQVHVNISITGMKHSHKGVGIMRRLVSRPLCAAFFLYFFICPAAFPFPGAVWEEQLSLGQPLTVRWEYETERTVNLTPAASDGMVYLPLTGGSLLSIRLADGELNWKEEAGGEFSASPLADERGVYIASEITAPKSSQYLRATGALRALARNSGVTLWMRTLQNPLRGGLASNETRLFGGSADGRVYAMRKETGEILWTQQFSEPFASQPVLSGGRLYIGGENGTLFALEQETGRLAWRYRTRGAVRGSVAVAERMVFFGSADNYVYALRETDGRLRWRLRTGAEVQAVAHTSRGLIVASLDNFVYLLSVRRGDRLWKRQLAGRIAAQPLIFSDSALFAPLAGDACVALDLKDGKFLNNLPVGEGNNMAASPVLGGQVLLVTTRRGLLAFAPTAHEAAK
jgi:outer membrane protein assembly factor BamB